MSPLRERRRRCLGSLSLGGRGDRRRPRKSNISSTHRCDQRQAGNEQQEQNHLAECRIVELSVELEATPHADNERGQHKRIELDRFDAERAGYRKRDRTHDKSREHDRLKGCALRVLGPATQLTPDGDCNSAQAPPMSPFATPTPRSAVTPPRTGLTMGLIRL